MDLSRAEKKQAAQGPLGNPIQVRARRRAPLQQPDRGSAEAYARPGLAQAAYRECTGAADRPEENVCAAFWALLEAGEDW